MNCHMLFLIEILKKSNCLFLQKQMATEFFQNYKWKINFLPKRFKKSVSPWTSTNNYSLRRQSSARIQKYFCPISKRHNFFYQTVINDCSSRILKQGPNSFEGLINGWLTLQSRTFQPHASTLNFQPLTFNHELFNPQSWIWGWTLDSVPKIQQTKIAVTKN